MSKELNFMVLKRALQMNFHKFIENQENLFEIEVDKNEFWDLYLNSYPAGTNEVYRERREYDCNCCKNFIRDIGNVAIITNDNKIKTIWDFKIEDADNIEFQVVIDALDKYLKEKAITNVYKHISKTVGTDKNYERKFEDGNTTKNTTKNTIEWNHFYLELPNRFVYSANDSIGTIENEYRTTKQVFKRGMDELTEDSLLVVLELIASNNLHRGKEWEEQLKRFLKIKKEYAKLETEEEKNNFAWKKSLELEAPLAKLRGTSIGTLLVDISDGLLLDKAVAKYEDIVSAGKYKRSKPIFTKKQLETLEKIITEKGYLESLPRRFAVLEDITVNNVLFSNEDSAKVMGGIFDEMKKDVAVDPKKFSKQEAITIENFIDNILPTCKEIEILLENKHSNNLVSLIAPQNKDSKTMFKWNNNFSWAYKGNVTDSEIKQRVKSVGADVTGILRISLQWNDLNTHNNDDLDLHCIEPSGNRIHFSNMRNYLTTGKLDHDERYTQKGQPVIENITWTDKSKMLKGNYEILVHNYENRGGQDGFALEVEFDDGQVFNFEYRKPIRTNEFIEVATVHFDGENFTITEKLPSHSSSKEMWNVKTNQFVPVSVVMYSPNYWDEQKGIGHKHYMFMLKNCINSETPNGFYNEFLNQELYEQRRAMEALGSKMRVSDCDNQLSGLGFSSTKRNELTVKVKGQIQRVMKITF